MCFVCEYFEPSVELAWSGAVSYIFVVSAVFTDLISVDIEVPRAVHNTFSDVRVNVAAACGIWVGVECYAARSASVMYCVDANGSA